MKKKTNKLIIVLSLTVIILLAFVIVQNTGLLEQSVFKKTAENEVAAGTLDTTGQPTSDKTAAATQEASTTGARPGENVNAKNAAESMGINTLGNPTEKSAAAAATSAGTTGTAEKETNTETNRDNGTANVDSHQEIWIWMHKMSNTKIVADEIWGRIEITQEELKKVEDKITNSSFDDKDKLLEILGNWKNGNFSKAVEEHNYLWEKLGGTVGKATGLADK